MGTTIDVLMQHLIYSKKNTFGRHDSTLERNCLIYYIYTLLKMWMLNMTTIYNLGIYLFKTLSMQKENKKPPEYNSLSSKKKKKKKKKKKPQKKKPPPTKKKKKKKKKKK